MVIMKTFVIEKIFFVFLLGDPISSRSIDPGPKSRDLDENREISVRNTETAISGVKLTLFRKVRWDK